MAKIKSLSEQVYEYIVHQIKIGALAFEDKISETDLIDQLGISRTPIREALIQLASDGILDNIPRKGFYVKSITPEAMDEAYAIIGQLDAYALKLAMPKMTDTDIDRMSVAIEKIDLSIEKRNYELYCSWQEEFHLIYLEICGNQTLIDLIKELERRNIRTTYFSADTEKLFAFLKIINEQHRELLKWIIEKNEEKAAEMIAKHWTMEF